MTPEETNHRYLLHILPSGFMKIRYYRFLTKQESIPFIQQLIEPDFKITGKQEQRRAKLFGEESF